MKNEKAKFTPGPWIVSSDGKAVRASADIMANYRRNVVNIGKRDNIGEMAANLSLCAAAPELLAALETAKAMINEVEGHKFPTEGLIQICSALRKAKGE